MYVKTFFLILHTVLLIGAGQNGLATAARLKALEVPALVVDKNERIGVGWRERHSLHDPVCESLTVNSRNLLILLRSFM